MNRKTSAAAALFAAIACPLAAHAQSVTIIGAGNPGAAGATQNTTGASAFNNTTRQEDTGPTTIGAGAIPSAGVNLNSGVTVNGAATAGAPTTVLGNTTGTTPGMVGGTTGNPGTSGAVGGTGSSGAGGAASGSAGAAAGGR